MPTCQLLLSQRDFPPTAHATDMSSAQDNILPFFRRVLKGKYFNFSQHARLLVILSYTGIYTAPDPSFARRPPQAWINDDPPNPTPSHTPIQLCQDPAKDLEDERENG